MGTTAVWVLPYPVGGDLPAVPLRIKALADATETALTTINTKVVVADQRVVKWGYRDTASSNATSSSAVGVLRIDGIELKAGQDYTVITGTLHPTSSVSTDNIRLEIRYSTTGVATTASAVLAGEQGFELFGNTTMLRAKFKVVADVTVSLLLCIARDTGSGNVTLYADGTRRTEMEVQRCGPSVVNSGVAV